MAVSSGYVVRETGANLKRNLLMTSAAILSVFVSLFLVACGRQMQLATNRQAAQWKGGVELSIFLQPTVTDNERDAIGKQLSTMPGVKKLRYVDKPQAYTEFKQMFANTPDLVNSLAVTDMPPSFRVVPTRPEDVSTIGDRFKNQPGVKEVVYAKDVINDLLKESRTKSRVVTFIAFGVGLAAFALIYITIQLAIFARRREVAVMKLVGATNWFVRWPFMLEGMICGVLGATGAVIVMFVSYEALKGYFQNNTLSGGNASALAFWQIAVILLVAGVALGAAGSGVTMRKFLRI